MLFFVGLAAGFLPFAFLGLVGGAYMSKRDRQLDQAAVRELRRANTALTSQITTMRAQGAPVVSAAPSHIEGR